MSEKKKILIFTDWFLPGYKAGGPVRSIENIINNLHSYFDFYVITSDRDLGDTKPYDSINSDVITKREKYKIVYLSPENQNKNKYKQLINEIKPHKIYFNSLFSYKFTLLPLSVAKKSIDTENIILAPRGMLGEGAINLKKTKKKLFLNLSRIFKLYSGITWHATTNDEADDIKKHFKNPVIFIAENIPEIPDNYRPKEKNTVTKFVFVSRISKKKNLLFALDILTKTKSDKRIIFDIYGPAEDPEYKKICDREINLMPDNIFVKFKGELPHNKVKHTLTEYHFFLFPTLHENYGHVIFESFSAGCPVVISKNTPWQNLEKKGIGWDINLINKEEFVKVIEKCADMSEKEYNSMSENTFNFAKKFSEKSQAITDTKKMFDDA